MPEEFHHPMVPPLFEREEKAVPGPFYVAKDQCIICEFPPSISPRCIRMNDALCNSEKYCHVFKQPETEEELDSMVAAMRDSCVKAIRYCGTDPKILKRLSSLGLRDLCDAITKPGR